MLYKKCACGCGETFPLSTHNKKFYNREHRERYRRNKTRAEPMTSVDVKRQSLSPEERWKAMSLAEIDTEGLRMHKSYGDLQSMRYNGTLPEEFGLRKDK